MIRLILYVTLLVISDNAQASLSPKLERFIKGINTDDLQGGAIAIISKGEVVYKNTFGHQKNSSNPITEHTLFSLASCSKYVSATAVALIADKGLVDLDKKIHLNYLEHDVNLKNILGHTTGYNFTGNKEVEQGLPRAQVLRKLRLQKPSCKPGKCYFYSNATFSLVDDALHTQGSNFADAIDILRKALKTNEIQIMPLKSLNNFAYPHKKYESGASQAMQFPPYYPKIVPASAGVFASINAMIELLKLQMGHRPDLISQKMLDQLYCPYILNHDLEKWGDGWPGLSANDMKSYYGLGVRRLEAKNHKGKDLIFHSGTISGVNTFIGFIPSEDVGIIVVLNQNSLFPIKTGVRLWEEFLK